MLDKKLQPKIVDFGLATLFLDDKNHIYTSHIASTRVDASYDDSLLSQNGVFFWVPFIQMHMVINIFLYLLIGTKI